MAYSLAYTPPESFEVVRDADSGKVIDPRNERSDLYSLGITLYALVVGETPFDAGTQVWAVVELSDGRVASGSRDTTIRIWDLSDTSGVPAAAYTGHIDTVSTLIELADGRVASGSWDGSVQIWDPDDLP